MYQPGGWNRLTILCACLGEIRFEGLGFKGALFQSCRSSNLFGFQGRQNLEYSKDLTGTLPKCEFSPEDAANLNYSCLGTGHISFQRCAPTISRIRKTCSTATKFTQLESKRQAQHAMP